MSKKACSPDNAACEGFFGRPKNTDNGATFEEFGRALDDFIAYCNNSRKKKSLGWMSPNEYRISLGYAA